MSICPYVIGYGCLLYVFKVRGGEKPKMVAVDLDRLGRGRLGRGRLAWSPGTWSPARLPFQPKV